MTKIGKLLTDDELLAGLAEECGELTQAALKLRRVLDGRNPTPVCYEDATERLYEEVADVLLYVEELELNRGRVNRVMGEKRERWMNRMMKNDGT